MDLEQHRAALIDSCRATDGVTSLVLYGSATGQDAGRRDQWSDLDFNVFFRPADNERLRAGWDFLPHRERVVLAAREGDNGGVVVYDDGMLYEFGAGQPWEIRDPVREVAIDGGDLRFGELGQPHPARDQVGLFLVKTYIGIGRLRRGERVAANAHIRHRALVSLCSALRQRLCPDAPGSGFDPLRRLERDLPEVATRLGDLLDRQVEDCARGMFELARELLEPGWDDFPSRGADVIAGRLGWSTAP